MAEESAVSKLGGFFRKAVFEESDTPETSAASVAPATAEPSVQPRFIAPVPENDPAYTALYGAVMERDTPYARFLKTLRSLESAPSDMRYSLAREVLKGNGVGLDQVLHSINIHVGILDSKKAEFAETVKSQENSGVKAMELECSDIEKNVEAGRAQIARLQTEIAEQEKRKTSLQGEISNQRSKIKSVVDGFQSAAAALAQKLELDRQKISKLGA